MRIYDKTLTPANGVRFWIQLIGQMAVGALGALGLAQVLMWLGF